MNGVVMDSSRTVFVVVAFETVDSYGTQVSHVDSVWATRALSDARAKAIVDDRASDWFAETEEHQVIGSDGGGVEGTRSEAKGRGAEMRPEQSGVSGGAAQEQVSSPARHHSIERRLDEALVADDTAEGEETSVADVEKIAREAIALLRETRNAADWAVETNDTTRLFSMLNKADKFLDGEP